MSAAAPPRVACTIALASIPFLIQIPAMRMAYPFALCRGGCDGQWFFASEGRFLRVPGVSSTALLQLYRAVTSFACKAWKMPSAVRDAAVTSFSSHTRPSVCCLCGPDAVRIRLAYGIWKAPDPSLAR